MVATARRDRCNVTDIFFTDAQTGIAVGGGRIFRTTNGGADWSTQFTNTSSSLYAVSFADRRSGMVVRSAGIILRTTDGSVSWESQSSGTTVRLRDISVANANTATAVGDSGTILRTTDAGTSWCCNPAVPQTIFSASASPMSIGVSSWISRYHSSHNEWRRELGNAVQWNNK